MQSSQNEGGAGVCVCVCGVRIGGGGVDSHLSRTSFKSGTE